MATSEANGPDATDVVYSLIEDGDGGAIISWIRRPSIDNPIVYDLYVQRVDSSGNLLWESNGTIIGEDSAYGIGHINASSAIVRDGTGGAIIAWNHTDEANDLKIFIQRIDPNGTVLWSASGKTVDSGQNPLLVSDDTGGAIMVYQQYSQKLLLRAQRFDSDHFFVRSGEGRYS